MFGWLSIEKTFYTMIKKIFSWVLVVIFTWGGLWLAILAKIEDVPVKQFSLAMTAAMLFCAAILSAGYGQSKKSHEKAEVQAPHE